MVWCSLWHQLTFFAPFFALGLCLPVRRWHALMNETYVCVCSAVLVALWYVALVFWEGFAEWADSACALPGQCTETSHFPDSVRSPYALGWATFYTFLKVLCQKALIGCAVLCVLGNATQPLSAILPMESICAFGARTIYGYILHWPFFIVLGRRLHLELVLYTIPDGVWPLCCFLVAVIVAVIFSCRFTERLFRWMILPYWLLDIPGLAMALVPHGAGSGPPPPAARPRGRLV